MYLLYAIFRARRQGKSHRQPWTRLISLKVRDLQRRQQEDAAKEERRLKSLADKEAAEKEKKAQMVQQEEAYALSLQVCYKALLWIFNSATDLMLLFYIGSDNYEACF